MRLLRELHRIHTVAVFITTVTGLGVRGSSGAIATAHSVHLFLTPRQSGRTSSQTTSLNIPLALRMRTEDFEERPEGQSESGLVTPGWARLCVGELMIRLGVPGVSGPGSLSFGVGPEGSCCLGHFGG